jgi:dihydropteroate synthase
LLDVKDFNPNDLLSQLKNVEKELGRVESERWAPREIDLDILFVENFEFKSEDLNIPHSSLYDRPFAFLPASEVCSHIVPPSLKMFDAKVSERYVWPELAAIMNVTPDSFSDGGKYQTPDSFLAQARMHLGDGADYLDIGAESTRPQAAAISTGEELQRLSMAFECLNTLKQEGFQFKTSLDSRNFEVISTIFKKYPLDLINDVSGLSDLRILNLVNENNLKAVCMHSLSVPADKAITIDPSADPIEVLKSWWNKKVRSFKNPENIFFDPGFGFGKNSEQSKYIIDHLDQFSDINSPIFLGYSRKSFLMNDDKDAATADVTRKLNLACAQILRFHDLKSQKAALQGQHGL